MYDRSKKDIVFLGHNVGNDRSHNEDAEETRYRQMVDRKQESYYQCDDEIVSDTSHARLDNTSVDGLLAYRRNDTYDNDGKNRVRVGYYRSVALSQSVNKLREYQGCYRRTDRSSGSSTECQDNAAGDILESRLSYREYFLDLNSADNAHQDRTCKEDEFVYCRSDKAESSAEDRSEKVKYREDRYEEYNALPRLESLLISKSFHNLSLFI